MRKPTYIATLLIIIIMICCDANISSQVIIKKMTATWENTNTKQVTFCLYETTKDTTVVKTINKNIAGCATGPCQYTWIDTLTEGIHWYGMRARIDTLYSKWSNLAKVEIKARPEAPVSLQVTTN